MEKAYAQALWQMIESGMEPAKAVQAIHAQLQAQGREALMPRIARSFEHLAARESARDTITLTVADKAHEHTAHKEASAHVATLGRSDLPKSQIEVKVDPTLIGGWRLEGQEHLVDASYKKHLLAIYNAATH